MRRILVWLIGLLLAADIGTAQAQRSFATPEAAATGLVEALTAEGDTALLDLIGSDGADLIHNPDANQARVERSRVADAAHEKVTVQRRGAGRAILLLGKKAWPLSVPLVRRSGGWQFDVVAGAGEILARRIGRDELAAISALRAFVRAQKDYASRLTASGAVPHYALYVQSRPGRTDGLWWDDAAAASAGPSPLASYVASQREFLEGREPGDPFHGYYFRVLTGQGARASGGAKSYLVDGVMMKGFALLAWPAVYGNSGIMTFLVGPDGRVLENHLGPETPSLVESIRVYDPDARWTVVGGKAAK